MMPARIFTPSIVPRTIASKALAGGSSILICVARSSGVKGIISAESAKAAGVEMIEAVMMLGSASGTALDRIAP